VASDQLRETTEQVNQLNLTLGERHRQITTMEVEISELREKEEELRKLTDERFIMQEKIRALELHLEGGPDGSISRGDRTFMNRGIQVKPPKQKERDIQTEPMEQMYYPPPQMMGAYSAT
jgi:hypothetical protein